MGGYKMNIELKVPQYFVLSLLLGIPFLSAWLVFAAMTAKDGREPITDWFDPILAGLTLGLLCFSLRLFLLLYI